MTTLELSINRVGDLEASHDKYHNFRVAGEAILSYRDLKNALEEAYGIQVESFALANRGIEIECEVNNPSAEFLQLPVAPSQPAPISAGRTYSKSFKEMTPEELKAVVEDSKREWQEKRSRFIASIEDAASDLEIAQKLEEFGFLPTTQVRFAS